MNNFGNRFPLWGIIVLLLLTTFSSCVKDSYDLGKGIDMTLQLGGDSLYLPLGSTETFTLQSLLGEDMLNGVLKVNGQGVYVLAPEGQETSLAMHPLDADDFSIDNVAVDTFFVLPAEMPGQQKVAMRCPIENEIRLDFHFDNIPESILALEEFTFSHTTLNISFLIADGPEDISSMKPDFHILIPDEFVVDAAQVDDRNRIHVTEFNQPSGYVASLPLKRIIREETPEVADRCIDFFSTVRFEGYIGVESVDMTIHENLQVTVRCEVDRIEPLSISGKFNLDVEPQEMEFAFGMVPEALKGSDVVLDFADPHIHLQLETDVDIALNARLDIRPLSATGEISELRQVLDIEIPAVSDGTSEKLNYWLAGSTQSMPEGYIFIPTDLAGIIRQLPDKIGMQVYTSVDTGFMQTIHFGKDYSLQADMRPEIPLIFGPDLSLSFCDTLTGLPDALAGHLAGNSFCIYGDVYSKFPLDFYMQLEALDEKAELIPLSVSPLQRVAAGRDEQEKVSHVEFQLADPERVLDTRKFSALRISCRAASDAASAGVPVTEAASFRAVLKLKVSGGLIVEAN